MRVNFIILFSLISSMVFGNSDFVPNNRESIIKGLAHLYHASEDEIRTNKQEQIQAAIDFKNRYINLTKNASAPTAQWGKEDKMITFKFKSLINRGENDPSNDVYGYLFVPAMAKNSTIKSPATILVHHVADDLGPEITLAKAAKFTNKGIVMLLYLPQYGKRSSGKKFITRNVEEFDLNILQSLVDIQQCRLLLSQMPNVDKDKIQLMGISLGALITLIDTGFDAGFARYGSLVGGADLAHIMSYRKEEDPNSETSQALAEINWSEDAGRDFLSKYDPITWAPEVKNKTIYFWAAENDELMDRKISVERAVEIFKLNNKVVYKLHSGKHRVDLKQMGITHFIKDIYREIMLFMKDNTNINYDAINNEI